MTKNSYTLSALVLMPIAFVVTMTILGLTTAVLLTGKAFDVDFSGFILTGLLFAVTAFVLRKG